MNSKGRQVSSHSRNRGNRKTRHGCARARSFPVFPLLLAAGLLFSQPLPAHESLYQYLEIRQLESGDYGISVPVHLSELAGDFGIDPNRGDLKWCEDLSPSERETLAGRARALLRACFRFTDPSVSRQLADSLSADLISAQDENSIRPGCAVASITLPRETKSLACFYQRADKRLMLVITRPGKFPRVLDHPSPAEITVPLAHPPS